jgi:hypothetical protein
MQGIFCSGEMKQKTVKTVAAKKRREFDEASKWFC